MYMLCKDGIRKHQEDIQNYEHVVIHVLVEYLKRNKWRSNTKKIMATAIQSNDGWIMSPALYSTLNILVEYLKRNKWRSYNRRIAAAAIQHNDG